ncbi:hypothetical protein P167DRAFT_190988 [Morchella conica CCBAS932]|uniref:Uncharacterized protein n=1 Tax=Morchella conica CCBAS932 TaxID=1392247 RepID=A0A3N4LFM5_9PEZI|nr:hypothetical protein P167DRAFT_190988 [Morchella conica CCBAS932]
MFKSFILSYPDILSPYRRIDPFQTQLAADGLAMACPSVRSVSQFPFFPPPFRVGSAVKQKTKKPHFRRCVPMICFRVFLFSSGLSTPLGLIRFVRHVPVWLGERKLNRDTCIVLSIRAERFLFLDRYRKYSLHGYGEMEVDGGWRFFFRGEKELFWKHSSFR